MGARVDHFMYAVASLDEGIEWATDTFGVAPAYGGEHVGVGTRNALMSLGKTYIEIIAPDPAQPPEGTFAERLLSLTAGGLVTWAAEGNLADIATALQKSDLATSGPTRTQRKTSQGDLLVWELLFPQRNPHGGRMPFFIDWLECKNPRLTNPKGGEFQSLSVTTPEAADLQQLFSAIDLDVTVNQGDPMLSICVTTARAEIQVDSTPETVNLWGA